MGKFPTKTTIGVGIGLAILLSGRKGWGLGNGGWRTDPTIAKLLMDEVYKNGVPTIALLAIPDSTSGYAFIRIDDVKKAGTGLSIDQLVNILGGGKVDGRSLKLEITFRGDVRHGDVDNAISKLQTANIPIARVFR